MRKQSTINRMKERVERLIGQFDNYVEEFEQRSPFTGPSVYFHKKTLEVRNKYAGSCDVLGDDLFFDYLYATLTAWGLHRMGRQMAKLAEISELKTSFQRQKEQIRSLQSFEIDNLAENEVNEIIPKLWDILSNLQVGEKKIKIKIVAGSKALHHHLPNLMVPIDGNYTLKFFYNNRVTALNQGDETAFREMYPYFWQIASACASDIEKHIDQGRMNTSKTKVIDNAIVGFVKKELPKQLHNSS